MTVVEMSQQMKGITHLCDQREQMHLCMKEKELREINDSCPSASCFLECVHGEYNQCRGHMCVFVGMCMFVFMANFLEIFCH